MEASEKYTQPHLSGKELEQASEHLLDALHDRQLRRNWQRQLADDYQVPARRSRTSIIRKLQPWLAVAASLVLVLSVWYWWPVTPKDHTVLLSEHLTRTFPNSEGRKDEIIGDSLRAQAIAAYINGNFVAAAQLREQVVERDSAIIEEDIFYLGLSYLYQQPPKVQRAIPYFEQASEWPAGQFTAESRWFLALAYLQNEQIPAARQILENIVATGLWPGQPARDLLEQLPD